MSNTAQLPDTQTAYNNLFEGIHSKVFFAKLASYGIQPGNQFEAQQMLETAGKLRQIAETETVKQAQANDNPFYRMNANLDGVLAQHGIGVPHRGHQERELAVKQAAAELAQDSVFYNSVLALKAAQAEEMKANYDAWKGGQ